MTFEMIRSLMKIRVPIISFAALLCGCGDVLEASSQLSPLNGEVPQGEEIVPCDGCPTFVRVPDRDVSGRRLVFAAKYELTWREFLKSVNDGSCSFSNQRIDYFKRKIVTDPDVESKLASFDIDWPVTILSVEGQACYIEWLSNKSQANISLPTSDEWNWLALGEKRTLYPWGDEPDASRAQVRDNPKFRYYPIAFGLKLPDIGGYSLICGPVGQYAPNAFGLYDMVGLHAELSSEVRDQADEAEFLFGPGIKREFAEGNTARRLHGRSCEYNIADATLQKWTVVLQQHGFVLSANAIRLVVVESEAE